jgi:hypothetical protein
MARLGLMFAAVALVLIGCGQVVKQSELDKSLATWDALKVEHGNHYRYETRSVSWTGFRSTTTLTVRNGEVIMRAYEARYQNDVGEDVSESWTEEGAAVGSHESGADPVTIDALYSKCRTEVLTQDPRDNAFYLDFHTNGVLKTCEYRPLACVDDCLFGVSVDVLEFLATKTD